VLRRGYSITRMVGGAPLTGVEELEPGARLETLLADGRVLSVVESASDEGPSAAPATGEPDA
jgi:exonuclease VII large subunit